MKSPISRSTSSVGAAVPGGFTSAPSRAGVLPRPGAPARPVGDIQRRADAIFFHDLIAALVELGDRPVGQVAIVRRKNVGDGLGRRNLEQYTSGLRQIDAPQHAWMTAKFQPQSSSP